MYVLGLLELGSQRTKEKLESFDCISGVLKAVP